MMVSDSMERFAMRLCIAAIVLGVAGAAAVGQGWDAPTARDMQDVAAGAVVKLHVYRSGEDVAGIVPAVLIEPMGRAVATAHPLLGATRVEARLPGVREAVPVQPVAISGELNLAIVQLDINVPMVRAVAKPRQTLTDEPKRGDKLWLVSTEDPKHKLHRTQIIGTAVYDDLDARTLEYLRQSPMTKWIEVEAADDAAHGAKLAFDGEGRFAGFVAWTWLERRRSTPILAAVHVDELKASAQRHIAAWGQLEQQIAGQPPLPLQFPELRITPGRTEQSVRKATHLLDQAAICSLCKGWGTTERKRLAGYESLGGGMRRPVFEYEDAPCPRCEGDGLATAGVLERSLAQLVDALARLNPDPADAAERAETLSTTSQTVRRIAGRLTHPLAGRVNPEAEALFTDGPKRIGQPVVLIGELVRDVRVPGRTDTVMGVRMGAPERRNAPDTARSDSPYARRRAGDDDPRRRVLVIDPALVDESDGQYAIVGGLLAGYVQYQRDLPPVPVLTRGLVAPLAETDQLDAERAERDRERQGGR